MEGEKVREESSPTLTTVGAAARARGRARRGPKRESCIVMAVMGISMWGL